MPDDEQASRSTTGGAVPGKAWPYVDERTQSGTIRLATEWPRADDGQGEGTWLELVPPDAPVQARAVVISRDELLSRLREQHHDISDRTLRAWEVAGVLPRPIRPWKEGSTRSAPRALYPEWAVDVVRMAHVLKGQGLEAELIRTILIRFIPKAIDSYVRGTLDAVISFALTGALHDITQRARWPAGKRPVAMEIRMLDEDGAEVHAQTIPLPEQSAPNADDISSAFVIG